MSKFLVDLLDVKEREFRLYIDRLEKVALNPGVDIRLANEIRTKTTAKLQLLESADASFAETQKALREKLAHDDALLVEKLRLTKSDTSDKITRHIAITASKMSENERALALTPAGLKRVLKAVPPSRTLKALGLRSLPSVMKRYDPRLLYVVALQIESKSWRSQVHARMNRAEGRDVAEHSVDVIAMPTEWLDKLDDSLDISGFYIVNRETASVIVLPKLKLSRAGTCVLALSLIVQAAQRIAVESLPYRRRNFLRGHQAVLQEIAHDMQPQLPTIHGLLPTWHVVYQLAGNGLSDETLDFVLDEIRWESVEMKLARLIPDLGFWIDTHYLACVSEDGVQSLHIVDVASDLALGKEGTRAHVEASLWNELQLRYLKEDVFQQALTKQLQSTEELVLY